MLWPDTAERTNAGALAIGGVSLPELAAEYGTPLYIYDEATLRARARRFVTAFSGAYPEVRVVYAAKALMSPAIVAILHEEGLGLDVVSGGELHAGLRAGVSAAEIAFHGNNKSEDELREAITAGVGHIVIDNLEEIGVVGRLAAEAGQQVSVMLRLNPGVQVDTHHKIATGVSDSKFGMPLAGGQAALAVARIVDQEHLDLVGYHVHLGSQLFQHASYREAIRVMATFAAEMRAAHGVTPQVISPGGGFGIAYEPGQESVPLEEWAEATAASLRAECARHDLPLPQLVVEPGRSIVGPAGVALYRVGSIKEVTGIRTYVSLDGGMADNIRPTLYGARYTAVLANRSGAGPEVPVTLAGRYCESGDVLLEDARLPMLEPGDLVAFGAAGAYCLAMASNYNMVPRPAVVLVCKGAARLIRRRETYDDLLAAEVLPAVG